MEAREACDRAIRAEKGGELMGREYAMVSCEEYDELLSELEDLRDENTSMREIGVVA